MTHTQAHPESFSEVEALLEQALHAGAELSPQARQQIWRTARQRADETVRPAARLGQFPVRFLQSHTRFWRLVLYPGLVTLMVLAFLSGYVGVVCASGASVSGEPLYAIERKAESLWLMLTPTSKRCEVQLALLQRRVYEVKALLEAGRPVPPDLLQEIELLFAAVAEAPALHTGLNAELVSRLIFYRDTLGLLRARHPGVRGLDQALSIADSTVVQLGSIKE